ncbi:MAG TPA: hypothetical protein K8V84_21240 [Nocardiopsis listeri]|uniref:hypothetical protein n=1 Tax=Nocardiopsis listeri TaxID=53440 RepID=UPI001E0F5AC9|nr:hypothetical protein [Nocardiopsis listeri]HJE61006.1 hypothetical protein [Nocardiopsis listeri]
MGGVAEAFAIGSALAHRERTGRAPPRRLHAGDRHHRPGAGRLQPPLGRRGTHQDRKRERHRGALRHLLHRRGHAQHRGQQAGTVRDPVPPDRRPRTPRRPPLRHT